MSKVKEKIIEIVDDGNTLKFKIKKMPATVAEKWLAKAVVFLAKVGVISAVIPKEAFSFTDISVKNIDFEKISKCLGDLSVDEDFTPLANELIESCCYRVNGTHDEPCSMVTIDGYVSEVKTLLTLKKEVFILNLAFWGGASKSAPDLGQIVINKMQST